MKIFPSIQIKQLDAYTIEHEPISSIDLMERAATVLTTAIMKYWSNETPVIVFAGPGNNGGDALAISRLLADHGYQVKAFLFNTGENISEDCATNKERLEQDDKVSFTEVTSKFEPPVLGKDCLVIDGLFGSGLKKPLSGGFAAVVKYINASSAMVVSIDLPSGLMCEDNTYNIKNHIIRSDKTLSIQLPKLSFFFAENADFLGEWELLDINLSQKGIEDTFTTWYLTEEVDIKKLIKPRKRFSHKGNFGNALLIAGAYGMAGASVLAAKACLKTGVGILNVHVPLKNNDILQTTVPEAIIQHDVHENCFASPVYPDNYSAVAIGPGLGKSEETAIALIEQIKLCQEPMVIDADALNILSEHRQSMVSIPRGSILTPHPKELERLVGKCESSYERLAKARDLATNYKIYIVLKGAYSVVITPDGNCFFNPTGNPGMATAGSGDVLTGVLLSLLSQGYTPEDSCKLGVYLHGLAGDLAKEKLGEIGMTAGDIVENLPFALIKLTQGTEK
ncbi:NAD(P)H-hydrate dehydratase [uncultured Bacteroides sp.]|uniref:NAD(P)H-hydrate dehydratase n=1 Tax=uncultured Bacteroides sp. TaxID=162156 RepID=UPI002AAAA20C|nr:NAD(P)H-hydrate dehydratase [uncultured Bacteroides sp.]